MSIKILMTGSEDFGKAEIELDDEHASVEYLRSEQFSGLAAEVVSQQTLLGKSLKASHGLSPEPTGPAAPHGSQPNPQFASNIPQPASPPAWAQQQPSNVVPIQQPQGGRACQECGQPLIAKQTSAGKNVWRCDAWRWNNGNPNNHTSLKPGEGF